MRATLMDCWVLTRLPRIFLSRLVQATSYCLVLAFLSSSRPDPKWAEIVCVIEDEQPRWIRFYTRTDHFQKFRTVKTPWEAQLLCNELVILCEGSGGIGVDPEYGADWVKASAVDISER